MFFKKFLTRTGLLVGYITQKFILFCLHFFLDNFWINLTMAFLEGKTPISFLQELCTKKGVTPQYDLLANEGAVHEPTFVFKVTAGEFAGIGKGSSKKKAKHSAALNVLSQLLGGVGDNIALKENIAEASGPTAALADEPDGNPVGELQEITQKRLWPPPVYEYEEEEGPPHARDFICTVKLSTFHESGRAKSKKGAKRMAAFAMVHRLKSDGAQTIPVIDRPDDMQENTVPLPISELQNLHLSVRNGPPVPALTAEVSLEIQKFYSNLKQKAGNSLGVSELLFHDHERLLQDVAKQHKFEVTYVDLDEKTIEGLYQALIQLATLPVAVVHGVGRSRKEARNRAAVNSLQYLRIMTRTQRRNGQVESPP